MKEYSGFWLRVLQNIVKRMFMEVESEFVLEGAGEDSVSVTREWGGPWARAVHANQMCAKGRSAKCGTGTVNHWGCGRPGEGDLETGGWRRQWDWFLPHLFSLCWNIWMEVSFSDAKKKHKHLAYFIVSALFSISFYWTSRSVKLRVGFAHLSIFWPQMVPAYSMVRSEGVWLEWMERDGGGWHVGGSLTVTSQVKNSPRSLRDLCKFIKWGP